jgi:nitrogen PTS system EIIA component
MPYRALELTEAAAYLHLNPSELEQLLRTSDIPHQRRGNRIVFLRGELDAWASQRILGLPLKRLATYHRQSTSGTRAVFNQDALVPELVQPDYIAPAMTSKARKSLIRDLVDFASSTGRVLDPTELRTSVEAREELCSTALPGGLALLHCRNHQPYRFDGSFLVLGRTLQEIHFGAPDGQPSWLFFLICCQDERLHLHALARLCLMAQTTDAVPRLLSAPDAAAMYDVLISAELSALAGKKAEAPPAPA